MANGGCLPFFGVVFCLGQFGDELAGILRLDVQRPPGAGRFAPGLMNPRQPGLSCALFLCRQALTRSTFGISALHKRNASPVHACCPSGVQASAAIGSTKTAKPEEAKAPVLTLVRD
jgi:hypothetical protein